jgi:hypothetical protein
MKHPGDPTPESAGVVLTNPRWRLAASYQTVLPNGTITNTVVVMHCGTETYWETTYDIKSYTGQMTWEQVEPVAITQTLYRKVNP